MIKLVAVVGPTASGKSALGVALARAFDGEIVSCDSTAVYRGLDIGTDKPSVEERGGVPHHLIDVVGPTETYSAARYATDAAAAVVEIVARARLPILVGGTGLYLRALVRGVFPGPARDEALRARLERVAARRGTDALHRWLGRVDKPSAQRIQPTDRKRMIRALEVYLLTGRPLTDHFGQTVSPLADAEVLTIGVRVTRTLLLARVSQRVDQQFARGVVAEVHALADAGVPLSAHAFSGLVYRQVVDSINGVRDAAATRELIVRENMRYAKRQLTWFKKEPNVHWIEADGGAAAVESAAVALVRSFLSESPRSRVTLEA